MRVPVGYGPLPAVSNVGFDIPAPSITPPPGYDNVVRPEEASPSPIVGPTPPPGYTIDLSPVDASTNQAPVIQDQGFFGDIGAAAGRGIQGFNLGNEAIKYSLGIIDAKQFAVAVRKHREQQNKYGKSPDLVEAEEKYNKASTLGAAGILLTNPELLASWLTENIVGSVAPPVVGGLAGAGTGAGAGFVVGNAPGAAAGAAGGAVVGSALGAAAAQYGGDFINYLQEHGKVDLSDEKAVEAALNNPELVNDAIIYAAKRGGIAGVLTAATGIVGGKVLPRFFLPGTSVGRKAAGVGAAMGISGGGEAATEIFGDIATGEPQDAKDVLTQFIIGSVMDLPSTVAGTLLTKPAAPVPNMGEDVSSTELQTREGAVPLGDSRGIGDNGGPVMSDPIFYSLLDKVVREKGQNAATPEQWMNMFKNNGVTSDEITSRSVREFLNREGVVTKQELQDFLLENSIDIIEDLQDSSQKVTKYIVNVTYKNIWGDLISTSNPFDTMEQAKESKRDWESDDGIVIDSINIEEKTLPRSVEYNQHLEPGAQNPKNLILRIPARDFTEPLPKKITPNRPNLGPSPEELNPNFVKGHWEFPNVIGWVRTSDRYGRNYEKTLFVEEVQSDWHQEGRRHGYRPIGKEQFAKRRQELSDNQLSLVGEVDTKAEDVTEALYNFWNKLFANRASVGNLWYYDAPTRENAHNVIENIIHNQTPATRKRSAATMKRRGVDFFDLELGYKELYTRAKEFGVFESSLKILREAFNDYFTGLLKLDRANDDLRLLKYNPPEGPFSESWANLLVKRMVRFAADNGYDRLAFSNGQIQIDRWQAREDERRKFGYQEFYDRKLVSLLKKAAARLGVELGEMDIGDHTVPFIEMNSRARTLAQQPQPMFQRKAEHVEELTQQEYEDNIAQFKPHFNAMKKAVVAVMQKLGFNTADLAIVFRTNWQDTPEKVLGSAWDYGDRHPGKYVIEMWPGYVRNMEQLWATLAHEAGHIMEQYLLEKAPIKVKLALSADHLRLQGDFPNSKRTKTHALARRRDNVVTNEPQNLEFKMGPDWNTLPEGENLEEYWLNFREYFAEQVAKWATTSEQALTVVEKFFKYVASRIRSIFKALGELGQFRPEKEFEKYLNQLAGSHYASGQKAMMRLAEQTRILNKRTFDRNSNPSRSAPAAPELRGAREMMSGLFGDEIPSSVEELMAQGDSFSRFHKYMISLPQLAKRNKRNVRLQRYNEDMQLAHLETANIQAEAMATLKEHDKLSVEQQDRLASLLDSYMNMEYMSDQEFRNKVQRRPTERELRKLAQDRGVSAEALKVFARIAMDFDRMLGRFEEILVRNAAKIQDEAAQLRKTEQIRARMKILRNVPYVPAFRYGDFVIRVTNDRGEVVHVELTESAIKQSAIAKKLEREYPKASGYVTSKTKLTKEVKPLLGMPPQLLDLMVEQDIGLSASQRSMINNLRFEFIPARSTQAFNRKMKPGQYVPGYSKDFRRGYGAFFFHGANHYARLKYVDQLREHIAGVELESRLLTNGNKRADIAVFMRDHLKEFLDPKPDFAKARQALFFYALGANIASATLNLSQMVYGTYPFLASKFGDIRAGAAMLNAGRKFSTYYKTGTLENATEPALRALNEGVKEAVITEAMAPELAAITDGRNLIGRSGGKASRTWNAMLEVSSAPFQLMEQVNRRVTFRAAWELAMNNPNAKYVREIVAEHQLQYDRLVGRGWTPTEAAAFVAAKDATQATQFMYGKHAQPRFMRGKKRALFAFKTFVQNVVFFLWNYPTAAARSILLYAFLGGLMGLPGAEDLQEVLKMVAWKLFGEDFDLEREARRFILDFADGKIDPDDFLHGASHQGFGIPALMELMGVPFPSFDRSNSMGIGQISPIPLGTLFGPPTQDTDAKLARAGQQASGALFGIGFTLVRALNDWQLDVSDPRRWEKLMPVALRHASQAMRYLTQGAETTRTGATVTTFDARDPEQLMEIIGAALGYQPERLAEEWDRRAAEFEVDAFWNIRKQALFIQADAARRANDTEEWQRVMGAIRKFNQDLPETYKQHRITRDNLRRSMDTRERNRVLTSRGQPPGIDPGIVEEMQRLYPDSELVDVRKVK